MQDLFNLRVVDVMTKAPRCIEPHQPVTLAREWMDELGVRHLPVRESGKLVGILSDRDLGWLLTPRRGSLDDLAGLTVEDVMISGVHTVAESQPLSEVTREMVRHKLGSVLVVGPDGRLTGIFTDTDALRILADQSE
jgi:acetoin utilization protein AcuB